MDERSSAEKELLVLYLGLERKVTKRRMKKKKGISKGEWKRDGKEGCRAAGQEGKGWSDQAVSLYLSENDDVASDTHLANWQHNQHLFTPMPLR